MILKKAMKQKRGLIENIIFPKNVKFFPTGSRYIKRHVIKKEVSDGNIPSKIVLSFTSDYDYVILDSYKQDVINHLDILAKDGLIDYYHKNTHTLKFRITTFSSSHEDTFDEVNECLIINFIFKDQKNFDAWNKATEAICDVASKGPELIFSDKDYRIRVFQAFVKCAGGDSSQNYGSSKPIGVPPF